jgi:hypothetical protein
MSYLKVGVKYSNESHLPNFVEPFNVVDRFRVKSPKALQAGASSQTPPGEFLCN